MNLYQEEILDHYKHPRNKKRLENPTRSIESVNPLCGDKLGLDVMVENGVIKDMGFWGEGCAISQAAMSMVTEEMIGQPVEKLQHFTKENVLELLGVPVGPSRLKCALLSLQIVEKLGL
jgi:nitrogen fixation NifU-like protein